jgi:hypothetical protein
LIGRIAACASNGPMSLSCQTQIWQIEGTQRKSRTQAALRFKFDPVQAAINARAPPAFKLIDWSISAPSR